MGGDFGPRLCVPATLKFLQNFPSVRVTLVGDAEQIKPLIPENAFNHRIVIQHTEQVVTTSDKPGSAFRHKRESSMWKAIEILAQGDAEACVSAGNTGALMAMARYQVKTFEGMSRPAICKPIPTVGRDSYLLDLGANLDCSPQQLLQFAIMGSAMAKTHGIENPKVALMNVGAETTKGNHEIQEAYALLEAHENVNFCGFVEGNHLYRGDVDVIVCDGFVGNVALKVSEGVASFILESLRSEFNSGIFKRILGALNTLALKSWRARFDPSKYNGAALLGLRKIVVKSHGGANAEGFYHALVDAHQHIEVDITAKLQQSLSF